MLFGRLRVPVERALAPEPRDRHESGFHVVGEDARGEAPHGARVRPVSTLLSLVPPALPGNARDEDFDGLDRLDREELDEE
jgi:hypothetical protein